MAKKILKRELVKEEELAPGQWQRTYKRTWIEVPEKVEEDPKPEESLPEPVAEKPKMLLSMSNTKAELLVEAERLGLDVNSGNTKSEILAAIDASQ